MTPTERSPHLEEVSYQDVFSKLKDVNNRLATMEAKVVSLQNLFLVEFGDGDRPGLLGYRIEALEKSIEILTKTIIDFKETLTGDGRVGGIADQLREHQKTIERWTWHFRFLYGGLVGLLFAVLKLIIK